MCTYRCGWAYETLYCRHTFWSLALNLQHLCIPQWQLNTCRQKRKTNRTAECPPTQHPSPLLPRSSVALFLGGSSLLLSTPLLRVHFYTSHCFSVCARGESTVAAAVPRALWPASWLLLSCCVSSPVLSAAAPFTHFSEPLRGRRNIL